MHCVELGLLKRFFHRVLIVGKVISDSQLRTLQAALGATVAPPTEQAPDKRLGDPGGGSATAAHWSTLGRRLLVLLLFVAWKDLVEQDGNVHYIPTAPAAPTAAEALDRNAEDVLAEEAQRARGDGGQDSDHDDSRPASPASGQSQERHRLPQGAVTLSTRQVLQNAAQLAAVATLVARRLIKHSEVDELEKLLRNFSITHRELFGDKALVYNVHMAMHIPDHIRTFGPAWHFSACHFESMNGQLGRTPTNRHRNGEIETTYTTAFTTNARFELMLSSDDAGLDVASARAPQVAVPPTLRLDFASFVRDQGAGIDIELGPSKPFTLPAPLYHSLLAHLRKHRPAGTQPFLPSWSDAAGGARVNGRMKEHDSIKLGHTMFRSKSARTNASKAFTHAVVRARNGAEDRLDLFAIERILSHEIMRAGTCLQSVFVQGRRAERASLPGFDQVIDEAGVGSILRLFWTRKEVWSEVELLPAAQVFSDAVTVPNGDLVGVSAGEALRCATL
ncbi:hypothetical protein OC844_007721 [Tilletia horrida]|nr:hypothetical protein OC844_007721 [Tilletia horrida]